MRWMSTLALLGSVLLAGPAMAQSPAQGQTIYETKGPNGPVYSNQPSPGARVVVLPPLNVMDAPPPPPPQAVRRAPAAVEAPVRADGAAGAGKVPQALPYRSLVVVAPANQGGVIGNGGAFEIRLAVDPPLQIGLGHAFAVSIDGRTAGTRYTATEFMIPAEFWGEAPPPPNQPHQLDVAILDREGRILSQAEPVIFHLRQITVQPRRRPESPRPPPGAEEPEKPPVPPPVRAPSTERQILR